MVVVVVLLLRVLRVNIGHPTCAAPAHARTTPSRLRTVVARAETIDEKGIKATIDTGSGERGVTVTTVAPPLNFRGAGASPLTLPMSSSLKPSEAWPPPWSSSRGETLLRISSGRVRSSTPPPSGRECRNFLSSCRLSGVGVARSMPVARIICR
ncbi:hypothetical protein E2C01_018854 [Portunus trituberculatus]|uniref:Secreted protein n=1 Tax=Portunus trituberculatus TaxID=210409 RepID=A0A5B7DVN0_PORTR|nr:hypothetical protein [Portunus trituberculatus]